MAKRNNDIVIFWYLFPDIFKLETYEKLISLLVLGEKNNCVSFANGAYSVTKRPKNLIVWNICNRVARKQRYPRKGRQMFNDAAAKFYRLSNITG